MQSLPRLPFVVLAALLLVALVSAPAARADKKADKKALKAAKKEFNAALRLIKKPKTRDQGVTRLRALAEKHTENVVGPKASETLREYGVGDEVEVILRERKRFKKIFRVKDQDVLEFAEKSLEELREFYQVVKNPIFKDASVTLRFYDSRALYRKITGLITAAGNFKVLKANRASGAIEGEIQWYFPQGTNVKNRDFRINSLLYHELAHYVNAIHFGSHVLPPVFEEGLAVYMETRLYLEPDQNNFTIRDRREAAARNGLGGILKFKDFVRLMNSERGFGRGDQTLGRWYGHAYSVLDYLIHGELEGKSASLKEFFLDLRKRTGQSKKLSGEELLEAQVKAFFGTDLKKFHQGLLKHAQKYRQI